MSYQLEPGEPLPEGIKRMAVEQVDHALEQLTHPTDPEKAVHEARKSFKKIRAVLRLVRNELEDDVYRSENICYRDAGRRLAGLRDSYVVVQTLDKLTGHGADPVAEDAFPEVRAHLARAYQAMQEDALHEKEAMADVATTLQEARPRIADWPIECDDFSAVYEGLRRVYRRGRSGLKEAYARPTAEHFHEWRKRVKYLWYHMRILTPAWPRVIGSLADDLSDLSDDLGDLHDLAQLRRRIDADWADQDDYAALVELLDRRREALRDAARPLGERIYVEDPATFTDRIEAYWQVWQRSVSNASIAVRT